MAPGKELVSHCWPESTSKDVTSVLCPCAVLSCVLLRDGDVGDGTGARDMAWKPQGGDAGDSSQNTGDGVGALGMEMLRMALTLQHGDVVCGMETLGTVQGHWVWHGDSRWHKDTEGSTGTLRMAR